MAKKARLKTVRHSGGEYLIIFDLNEGIEILNGINGNPDPFELEYPSMLDIGIMGHCHNKCNFCYQGDEKQEHMTFENFKQIIDESKPFTNQVALGGRGDPNLHPNFEEFIKYARWNYVVPNYTTSGNGLTRRQAELTAEFCGAVAVSNYDKSYTYDAINTFIQAGVRKINIHFLLSFQSLPIALDIINGKDVWGGKIDIDKLFAIIFLLFKPQGRGKYLPMWSLNTEQIKFFAEAIKEPKCKFVIGLDSCLVNKVCSVRDLTPQEELYSDTCEGARMSCYITPDMLLVPCSFGPYDKRGISLDKFSIKEAWQKEPFKMFRDILKRKAACCPYEEVGDIK